MLLLLELLHLEELLLEDKLLGCQLLLLQNTHTHTAESQVCTDAATQGSVNPTRSPVLSCILKNDAICRRSSIGFSGCCFLKGALFLLGTTGLLLGKEVPDS